LVVTTSGPERNAEVAEDSLSLKAETHGKTRVGEGVVDTTKVVVVTVEEVVVVVDATKVEEVSVVVGVGVVDATVETSVAVVVTVKVDTEGVTLGVVVVAEILP